MSKKNTKSSAQNVVNTHNVKTEEKSKSFEQNRLVLPFVAIALVLCTWLVLGKSLGNQLTSWDDNDYITNNALLDQNIDKLHWFKPNVQVQGNYHPLTMISLSMDYNKITVPNSQTQFIDPAPFHITNLMLHCANVLLVLWLTWLLSKQNMWVAGLSGLLFAIHPMHVESVVWIAERKDVLYGFFFLLGLIVYLYYIYKKLRIYYFICLALFILSALSKPAAVVFPIVLLLLDYFNDNKLQLNTVLQKIPFVLVSVFIGIKTLIFQKQVAAIKVTGFDFIDKIMYASYALCSYVYKFFVPLPLKIMYVYPSFNLTPWYVKASPLALLVLVVLVYYFLRKNRTALFGLGFFVVNLVLVLQFVTVGASIISERYTYIAYIGLAFVLLMAVAHLKPKNLRIGIFLGILLLCCYWGYASQKRCLDWFNDGTLYSSILELEPNLHGMRLNRGNYYLNNNDLNNALVDYKAATRIDRYNADGFYNCGIIYERKGQLDSALEYYNQAIALNKADFVFHFSKANVLRLNGNYEESIAAADACIAINPAFALAYSTKAAALLKLNQNQHALDAINKAQNIEAKNLEILTTKAFILSAMGNYDQSLNILNDALPLNPAFANTYIGYVDVYMRQGNKKLALEYATKANAVGAKLPESFLQSLR